MSGELHPETKYRSDALSVPGNDKACVMSANNYVSLSVSDHNTDQHPKDLDRGEQPASSNEGLPIIVNHMSLPSSSQSGLGRSANAFNVPSQLTPLTDK